MHNRMGGGGRDSGAAMHEFLGAAPGAAARASAGAAGRGRARGSSHSRSNARARARAESLDDAFGRSRDESGEEAPDDRRGERDAARSLVTLALVLNSLGNALVSVTTMCVPLLLHRARACARACCV